MIELREVTKEYSKGVAALNGINLKIEQGEFVFIVGDSGSGKSTLIKLIMKELEPTSGTIIVNGNNLSRMKHRKVAMYRRNIGVVFQDFRLLKDRNIYENIAFAQRVTETPTRIIKKKVPAALSLVGLAQKYKAFPKELSGGEQQRVALARALVNNPSTIIADEPTGNLDPERSMEIMTLLVKINQLGTTVVVVTHEMGFAREVANRVIFIDEGVIKVDKPPQEFFKDPDNPRLKAFSIISYSICRTATGSDGSPAVQDAISAEAKSTLFTNIQKVVTGQMTAEKAVATAIQRNE